MGAETIQARGQAQQCPCGHLGLDGKCAGAAFNAATTVATTHVAASVTASA